ncbi:MAG: DUF4160 domain-containing protein [Bacteroidota bacterium]
MKILWNCNLYIFLKHNPPHFHVKYQEYEAIIEINNGIVKGVLPRRALTLFLTGWIYIKWNN